MLYQVQKRVFSVGDKYDILDANGQPVLQVKSHLLSLGHKLDVLDMAGNALARIQQRMLSFVSEYDIYRGDQVVAVVKKQIFSLLHPRFTVDGPAGTYAMEGDWLNWNYTISQNGLPVARISKEFSIFQDRYGIDIQPGADVETLLCLVIVMDEVAYGDRT